MAQVFTDSVSVKLYEEEESESWLRDVPGAPGLKWSLSVVPVKKDDVVDHIGAYVRVVGGRTTVSGTFHAVDHGVKDRQDTKEFKFDFADGEKHGIDHLLDGNGKLSVEVTCNATFVTLPLTETLAPAIVHESVAPSARGSVDTVTKSKQNRIKMPRIFTDFVSVCIGTGDLDDNESELRDIPGAPGIKWSLLVVADGDDGDLVYGVKAYIRVTGGPVTVSGTFQIEDCDKKLKEPDEYDCTIKPFKYMFVNGGKKGIDCGIDETEELSLCVTCYATFTLPWVEALAPAMIHDFFDRSKPDSLDAVIEIDEKFIIKVHRDLLSMISSVFKVMFGPDTEETKTGVIKITDFTPETVKNAFEFCYGYNVEQKTTSEITDMIRFCNKFNIQPAVKKLTAWLKEKSTVQVAKPVEK